MNSLKEKYGSWALITGASSGIGAEFARKLAGMGLNLVLAARRIERLEELASLLSASHNVKAVPVKTDLTREDSIHELFRATEGMEIGILINNAGFGSTVSFADADPFKDAEMVKLNCLAPVILTHHYIRPMIERKRGAVLFLGSTAGYQPTPLMSTYAATKVFNIFLGSALWYELKQHNIDVLSLSPGGTNTEFQRIADISTGPFSASAEDVVNTALNALGRKPSVINGFANRLMSGGSKILPFKLSTLAAGYVSDSMQKKYKK